MTWNKLAILQQFNQVYMLLSSRTYTSVCKDIQVYKTHRYFTEIRNLDSKSLRFNKILIAAYLSEMSFSYFYYGKNLSLLNMLLPRKQEQMHVQ